MFRGQSISLKQGLLLVVLAALLPISLTGIFQSTANWDNMKSSAMAGLEANAKAVAERERASFLLAERLLMVAATNPDVRDITPQCDKFLRTGFNGFDPIVNFVRADADGVVRCSLLPFRQGTSFKGQAWWELTRNATSISVGQPTIGAVSGVPVIIMALPLTDAGGQFAGTLSAGFDISKLAESVAGAPEGKTGFIAIISPNGELVASSKKVVPFKIPANMRNGVLATAESASGKEWIYRSVSISDNDLFVLYAEPRSKVMSAALTQLRTSIILPLIAIILTLSAIWFGTNRLVIRWLAALRKLSDDMTKGNFADNRGAFADAPLELRELSDDLHDMANVIDSRTTELTDALNAKTALTREVHHRVKNNLQIVTSLLTMQAARITDEGAQTALKQSRARIVAMALIHRLTYEQDTPGTEPQVTVEILIRELSQQLRYAHRDRRNITLSCRADDYSMPVDFAVPFALFIVEAVTNSFRHAFAEDADGKIKIEFVLNGNDARLEVNDNGQGYEVETPASRQLGSELMEGFASQLNGEVTFYSNSSTGSSTTLRFPAHAPLAEQRTGPSAA